MNQFPSPHGDKLKALKENSKLDRSEVKNIEEAIEKYNDWRQTLVGINPKTKGLVSKLLDELNNYKNYIDIELIFDSKFNFLYRQKGQIKLDNTVVEEFLPIFVSKSLNEHFKKLDLELGPTKCFSGLRFESDILSVLPDAGVVLREKDQDFAISRKLYLKASHNEEFNDAEVKNSNLAYLAAECKTNLDKTMFQEAAATAQDVRTAVPSARYYLLCEWLDMTPISTSITPIDEIIILRKAKRISSNIRKEYSTYEGRMKNRESFKQHLEQNPFAEESFLRFLSHIESYFSDNSEDKILDKGFF